LFTGGHSFKATAIAHHHRALPSARHFETWPSLVLVQVGVHRCSKQPASVYLVQLHNATIANCQNDPKYLQPRSIWNQYRPAGLLAFTLLTLCILHHTAAVLHVQQQLQATCLNLSGTEYAQSQTVKTIPPTTAAQVWKQQACWATHIHTPNVSFIPHHTQLRYTYSRNTVKAWLACVV
jgi:hypothetical protein